MFNQHQSSYTFENHSFKQIENLWAPSHQSGQPTKLSNLYRKQPSLSPDQPLPQPVEGSDSAALGIQHAFWCHQQQFDDNHSKQSALDFSQTPLHHHVEYQLSTSQPVAKCDIMTRQDLIDDNDSDSYDFNE